MIRRAINQKVALWLILTAILTVPLILLTIALGDGRIPSQDQTVLAWVTSHGFRGLGGISAVISAFTNTPPAAGIWIAAVALLWMLGMNRTALGFAIVAVIVFIVAFLGDLILGGIVDHVAPSGDDTGRSFPSGHVLASTVFYGFWGFLGVYYGLKKKILIPILGLIVALVLAVGFSRMFEQAHWPSDVAAAYLLGGLWLLLLIPSFLFFQRVSWLASAKQTVTPE